MAEPLPQPAPPPKDGKPIPLWILIVFIVGGTLGGWFAAKNGNWFDVFLAGTLVVASVLALVYRTKRSQEPARAALVLTEDPASRDAAVGVLTAAGFGAEIARDAGAARAFALDRDTARLAVLVTDVSGQDLANTLRRHASDLRVVFLTHEDPETHHALLEDGDHVAVLRTPVRRDELGLTIRTLFDAP